MKFQNCLFLKEITFWSGFSLTPYLESFTPTFGLGTPVFPRISSNLHCGTPTFSKRCLWDSYFQNPSENPVGIFRGMKTTTVPEIVFHIFIDNDTSLIEKYNPCLMRKQYMINTKQEMINRQCKMPLFYNIAILPGYSLKVEP